MSDTKKDKWGRPTVMTPDIVNKLEQAFALGCTDLEACFYAGISKQTLYNYQEKNPSFIDRKEELKSKPVLLARETVMKGIAGFTKKDDKGNMVHVPPDPKLAFEYLKGKMSKEFKTGLDVNVDVVFDRSERDEVIEKWFGKKPEVASGAESSGELSEQGDSEIS